MVETLVALPRLRQRVGLSESFGQAGVFRLRQELDENSGDDGRNSQDQVGQRVPDGLEVLHERGHHAGQPCDSRTDPEAARQMY